MLSTHSNPGNQCAMPIMGFQGSRKSTAMICTKPPGQDRGPISVDRPPAHRSEFPAGYSSAGCSPAEPASASPATTTVARARPVVRRDDVIVTATQSTPQIIRPLQQRRPTDGRPKPSTMSPYTCPPCPCAKHLSKDEAASTSPHQEAQRGDLTDFACVYQVTGWLPEARHSTSSSSG